MLSPNTVAFLRRTPSEQLVEDFQGFCRERFQAGGIDVVIAERNGEADLPSALIGLAFSDVAVMPTVVDNGSDSDRAFEIAQKMGAQRLRSEVASKVAALQLGTRTVLERSGSTQILYTDDDTIVSPAWARRMTRGLGTHNELPVGVNSGVVFEHGGNWAVDGLRTAYKLERDVRRRLRGLHPTARGYSMGLDFGSQTEFSRAYQSLRHDLFPGVCPAIYDQLLAAGGTLRHVWSPQAIVATRGDRASTVAESLGLYFRSKHGYRARLYQSEFPGDYQGYNGSNAFERHD